jgi:hypothetical protein
VASNERSATPQGAALFVLDGFDRMVASGFGVAQTGGAWTVSSTTQTKVQNSEGVMYGIGAGQDVRASIGSSTANQEILVLTRLSAADPVGGGYDVRAVARAQTDTRRGYVARVGHTSTGGVTWTLTLVKNTNGSGGTVTLGSGTLATSGAAGSSWWIRLRAQGTSISVKYWQNGTAEPTAWTRTATDGTFSTGTVSVGVAGSSTLTRAVTDVGFASVQATKLG